MAKMFKIFILLQVLSLILISNAQSDEEAADMDSASQDQPAQPDAGSGAPNVVMTTMKDMNSPANKKMSRTKSPMLKKLKPSANKLKNLPKIASRRKLSAKKTSP